MIAKDVKQVCQKTGPSVVLIGSSTAPDGLLKLCGSDRKPENQKKVGEDAPRCCDETTPKQGTDERKFQWTSINQVE